MSDTALDMMGLMQKSYLEHQIQNGE